MPPVRSSSSLNGGSFAAAVCCYQAACIHVDGDNLILEPKRSSRTAFGAVGSRDLVARGWRAIKGLARHEVEHTLGIKNWSYLRSTIRETPVGLVS